MRLRTANQHRKRALRRSVYEAAFAYHYRRTIRLMAAGREDKLANSGFLRRFCKKAKAALRAEGPNPFTMSIPFKADGPAVAWNSDRYRK